MEDTTTDKEKSTQLRELAVEKYELFNSIIEFRKEWGFDDPLDLELLKYMQVLYVVDTYENVAEGSAMNFENMHLRNFDFAGKELYAHFNGADLRGAIFNYADLDFSQFKEAKLNGTKKKNKMSFERLQI